MHAEKSEVVFWTMRDRGQAVGLVFNCFSPFEGNYVQMSGAGAHLQAQQQIQPAVLNSAVT